MDFFIKMVYFIFFNNCFIIIYLSLKMVANFSCNFILFIKFFYYVLIIYLFIHLYFMHFRYCGEDIFNTFQVTVQDSNKINLAEDVLHVFKNENHKF